MRERETFWKGQDEKKREEERGLENVFVQSDSHLKHIAGCRIISALIRGGVWKNNLLTYYCSEKRQTQKLNGSGWKWDEKWMRLK